MSERYITRWSNIGVFGRFRFYPCFGVLTPWGNLIVKKWADRLFSERYGHKPTLKVGPLCISWVRLRSFTLSELVAEVEPQETPLMAAMKKRKHNGQ